MRLSSLVVLLALSGCAFLTGCATVPKRHFQRSDYESVDGWVQKGLASWYGPGYRGKPTASGERFDPDDLTAAHRTLALGTIVQVRNLRNGRVVLVEINDRGPYVQERIIDLSEKAAMDLGMIGPGVIPVEIRKMKRRYPR